MTGQRIATRAAACAAVALLVVTGGTVAQADDDIESLPAEQIADRSRDALLDVGSLHLRARGDLGKNRSPMTVDLSLDRSGNCAGGVDLGEGKGEVEIIKRGDSVWVKPDADFWENQVPVGGSTFESVLAGRYLKGSASDSRLRPVVDACDLDTFQKLVSDNADSNAGTFTKGKVTTVDGVRAVPVTRTLHGQKLTAYVDTAGEHRPVRITVRGDGADAVVDFSGFDEPVPTATPPAEDTVDVSAVLGRGPAQS
ncbi:MULTISPECIES: hypothetical protein [Streptomyces]|uniref:Lipoprotein n=1 Tax=Streptomyces glycanivorans TaxID=3033808 RepID=A0ABY9J5F3_9ACTN|nr:MULTISPECIES: hypothetical protein [unclassified Streptomyces]WSQ76563.1 hypothetical protein OG725_05405 [Streptomyces sp. NBC_01213]TXS20189.1 hypothetical protein EAO68_00695 [Streptomyces sp. wa22]WLQ63050.1 hypothetical protein P8A20_05315 [Streptomyces sp. Alt3]WSQ83893.1 hypothetical protein OG722_05830 [Streptomyces sp. NBC_01212]WSR10159.1 hypothetical protein OG265_30940 [Streptomyces sp. NBC_01208]